MPIVFDGRLARKVRRMFQADIISVTRTARTVDGEGDATGARVAVDSVTKGTLRGTSDQEDQAALQRGTKIDKVLLLELGLDVRGGDWVTVNGVTYEVVEIDSARLHQSARLRVVA